MANDFLSDEDKALFREQMRSVKPLKEKNAKIDRHSPPPQQPWSNKKHTRVKPREYFLSDFISEPVQSDSILSFCHSGIPKKRFNELKKGLIPYEGRLDLHGMYSEDARQALVHFITQQFEANKRCLLIIHGKGGHQGTPPIIKNLVNRWLPQFNEILAYHSALSRDGGNGAVYVLLKKNNVDND